MRVADKTVAFVKEWINGKFTRRQYQNYYVVKTAHAEFLMKLTEKRELLATRDPTNHIYVWDENDEEDNAFSQIIHNEPGFVWPNGFTRSSCRKMGNRRYEIDPKDAVNQISKFRVCERHLITPAHLPHPIYVSLIALGDRRFYCLPDRGDHEHAIPLKQWAWFHLEQAFPYRGTHPNYEFVETVPNIEKVERIRGHYLDLAGEVADQSTAVDTGWISIPTQFNTTDEIAGLPLSEMRKTRPNPFAYGLSPWHFEFSKISVRDETAEENVAMLDDCVKDHGRRNLPDFQLNWREYFKARFPSDMAANYIAYVEADDAWLEANSEAAKAFSLEVQFRHAVGTVDGWLYATKEDDKRFGPFALYYKTEEKPFTRIVPTPKKAPNIFGRNTNDYE